MDQDYKLRHFKNNYIRQIDPELKIPLPESYKKKIEAGPKRWVIVPVQEGNISCLEIMTENMYRTQKKLTRISPHKDDVEFRGRSRQLHLDGAGNLQISGKEATECFPSGRVRVAGLGDYFAIYPPRVLSR